MPILSSFPGGGNPDNSSIVQGTVSDITTQTASGKVYVKWADPDNLLLLESVPVAWAGTLLVRKAGSAPTSRHDGTIVLDNTTHNLYADVYFCDSGLTDGVTYYYKFFPYTASGAYVNNVDNEFTAVPTVQVPTIDEWVVTGMQTSSEAGDGKMNIQWTDPAATIIADGVTLATWASTTIVVKEGNYPTTKNDPDASYTLKVTTHNQYATSPLTVTGLVNGTKYYIAFFPETTDGGINAAISQRITGTANRISIIGTPTQRGSLIYNSNTQSPSWDNYNTSQLLISGDVSGLNAGSYTAIFTPATDYRWSDGSIDSKSVGWSIGKAIGSLTVSASEVELSEDTMSATVTVTCIGDGVINVTSNNAEVVSVNISNHTVTISSPNRVSGNAVITVSMAEGSNYSAAESAQINVAAKFLPVVGTALNDCTWEEISKISAAGLGSSYWEIGDCKAVHVNGTVGVTAFNNTFYVYIIAFNHGNLGNIIDFGMFKNALTNGTDTCLQDDYYGSFETDGVKYFNMNHSGETNVGGWKGCDLRYDILGSTDVKGENASTTTATNPVRDTLMAALPQDLRSVMKPMSIYTDNVGGGSSNQASVSTSIDYLPLYGEYELFGKITNSNSYENIQTQYAYYLLGNSTMKQSSKSSNGFIAYYLRSPSCKNNSSFCAEGFNQAQSRSSDTVIAIAPIFRV